MHTPTNYPISLFYPMTHQHIFGLLLEEYVDLRTTNSYIRLGKTFPVYGQSQMSPTFGFISFENLQETCIQD